MLSLGYAAELDMKGSEVARTFEYKFVRLGEGRTSAFSGVQDKARNSYEPVVHEHARDGWRLVQIFAPGVAAFGAAKYYELIFERESPVQPESIKRNAEMAAPA